MRIHVGSPKATVMVELVVQILVEVDAEESVFAKSGEDDVVVTARFVSRLQFNPVDQSGRFCDQVFSVMLVASHLELFVDEDWFRRSRRVLVRSKLAADRIMI